MRGRRVRVHVHVRFGCSLSRHKKYDFESRPNGNFVTHIKVEHDLWNYLFFIMHLRRKERTEYTAHEQYVSDMLDVDDIRFFPMGAAISLT